MSNARSTSVLEPPAGPPLELRWGRCSDPLPVREVRPTARMHALPHGLQPPAWVETGSPGRPFDFCGHVRRLCEDVAVRSEPLRHIDVSRVLFAFTQARNRRTHGLQARTTPLRFRGGQLVRRQGGMAFRVQRYFVDGKEILYVISFCLPRFLNQDFDDKFVTLFHELYHVCPRFSGDLRRFEGRCAVHTASQKRFDEQMAALARGYLASGADPRLYDFLRLNEAQLRHRHGGIVGVAVPRPKMIPMRWAARVGR